MGQITSLRYAQVADDQGKETFVRIIDPATYFNLQSFAFVDGTEAEAKAALGKGGTVLMPSDRATALNKTVGDLIEIKTTQGPHSFRIVGTYATLGGPPEIVLGLPDGRQFFNAGDANAYALNVTPGTDPSTLWR